MIYSEYEAEQDLTNLIEETFDTCDSNKDEIRWLISLLRGFMNIPNKRIEPVADNYKINDFSSAHVVTLPTFLPLLSA